MALAFDSLSYARYLRDHGIPPEQAEAHTDAVRNFVMINLATQEDTLSVRQDLANVQTAIDTLNLATQQDTGSVRQDLAATKQELTAKLETAIDNLALRLIVRLGIMLAAGIAALAQS